MTSAVEQERGVEDHPDSDLAIARGLVEQGVPVFIAKPAKKRGAWDPEGGTGGTGYRLPDGWQTTHPDVAAIDSWEPGDALCAVMGHRLDLVDIDPRNGGDQAKARLAEEKVEWPRTYAETETPSGGSHEFIAPLRAGSRDGLVPGLDVKGGRPDGSSRGFAFIPPTRRASKTTGEIKPYTWIREPDLDGVSDDTSGRQLAERIRRSKTSGAADTAPAAASAHELSPSRGTARVPPGQRHHALLAFAGALRSRDCPPEEASRLLRAEWDRCLQPPDDPFPWTEAQELLEDVYRRYPPGIGEAPGNRDFEVAVAEQVQRYRVQEAAKRAFRAEQVGDTGDDDRYLTRAQLLQLPRPSSLIDGVIHRHSYAVLRGRDATYKTFQALDWALHVATGREWNGHRVQQARVLYIVGEGVHGFQSRVEAWEYHRDQTVDEAMITFRHGAVNMYTGGPPLERLIQRVADGGYGLVVIDTLNRASVGADANSSSMNVVLENIDRIKNATSDGSVLVIAHTDKGDKDTRGFSAIEDDADIVFHTASPEDRLVRLKNTKMKDGLAGSSYSLRAETTLASLVLVATTPIEDPGLSNGERLVIREITAGPGATASGLAKQLEVGRGDDRLSRSQTYKVVNRLVETGVLDRADGGVLSLREVRD